MDKVITRDKVRSGLRIDTLTPLKVAVPVLINDVSVVMISSGSGEKPHNGIVAVIPAFNEERFIGSIVLKVRQQVGTVIVVDDGSNDCTSELAATCGAVVIRHIENHGKGTALNTGFNLARQYKPDAVVMLDADGQHLSDDLMRVAAPILDGRADIAIGSRYLQSTSRVPRHRIWGHWGFNLFTRLTSGESCTDSQSGYRAFSLHALECIDFRSEGFSVESEMQYLAHEKHLRIVEAVSY